MKVFICKFYIDTGIVEKIEKLASRERKKYSDKLKIVCVDEPNHKKLEVAGISCEAFYEFDSFDADDNPTWEKAYQLSDEIKASAENNETLKYRGINFLSFAHTTAYYIYALRLANLFQKMAAQGCPALVVVIPKNFSIWLQDINTPNIKTIKYKPVFKSFFSSAFFHTKHQSSAVIKKFITTIKPGDTPSIPEAYSTQTQDDRKQHEYKVLFVVRTPLYTNPALYIAEECIKQGIQPYGATDSRELVPLWQRYKIPGYVKPLFIEALFTLIFHSPELVPLYFRLRKHVTGYYRNPARNKAMHDEFSHEYLFRKTLHSCFPRLFYEGITDIIFLERVINTISPDIICVMPESHLLEQVAVALGKKAGNIPSLACSAAWETGTSSAFRQHLHADKLATSGEKMRQLYIESGVAPQRVVATGIAHFDALFQRDKSADRQILLENSIVPEKPFVIFATDNIELQESMAMLTGVIDVILKKNDLNLIVKVHPREPDEPYKSLAEKYNDPRIKVFKTVNLYALLDKCRLLVTKGSTVALEAMMIGKPVLIINLTDQQIAVPYVKEGAAPIVFHREDIESAVVKMLYDEKTITQYKAAREKFVRDWAHEPDGRASERIVALMKEMIRDSNRSN